MDALRTPDDRFADLPGYAFEPRYVEIPDGEVPEDPDLSRCIVDTYIAFPS